MRRPKRSASLSLSDGKPVYENSFQAILDGFVETEEEAGDGDGDGEGNDLLCLHGGGGGGGSEALGEKKRRLNLDQVKALERNFEVENKLEPERKVKLAQELGLQPRQVAVWFQNRRARSKTKQLERDYGVLKSDYDSLRRDHDSLRHEHNDLLAEVEKLKGKLGEKKAEVIGNVVAAEEGEEEEEEEEGCLPPLLYKDGSSDSDSSAILNEDGSGAISSSSGIMSHHHRRIEKQALFVGFDCSSPSSRFEMEEQDFLHGGGCFFSDEEAPTLPWYDADRWNSDLRLDI